MHTRVRSETVVIQEPQFIFSRAEFTETTTIIHTSASIAVRESDTFFQPVRDFVGGQCYTVRVNELRKDPNYEEWWDGEYRVSAIQIHKECPGTVPHFCSRNPISVGSALGMGTEYNEEEVTVG